MVAELNQVKVSCMGLDLGNGYAFQRYCVMRRICDNRIMSRIGRLGTGHDRRNARKQGVTEINRVFGYIKIANRRTFEVVVEDEIVLSTSTENGHAVADIVEGVISGGSTHRLEVRHVCRRTRTNDGYCQGLAA